MKVVIQTAFISFAFKSSSLSTTLLPNIGLTLIPHLVSPVVAILSVYTTSLYSHQLGILGFLGTFQTTYMQAFDVNQRVYELHDHLGNVRSLVRDQVVYTAFGNNVTSAGYYSYYAFGSLMPGTDRLNDGGYKFGFNGQEKDDYISGSGNSMAFKFREQDTRIGRFMSVDPLRNKYPYWSPYAFAANNPIAGVDLEGMEFLPVNSSMYRMTHLGTTPISHQIADGYKTDVILSKVPDPLKSSKGEIMYNLGAPVGTNGQDIQPYISGRQDIPSFNGIANAPDDGDPTDSWKGNMLPGKDNVKESASGLAGIKDLIGMAQNAANSGVWNASYKENKNRFAYYNATNLVDNSKNKIDQVFTSGQGRADMVNLLVDGTLPNINFKGYSQSEMRQQSGYLLNLMENGFKIASDPQNGIDVQPEMFDKYREISDINKRNGGNGGNWRPGLQN